MQVKQIDVAMKMIYDEHIAETVLSRKIVKTMMKTGTVVEWSMYYWHWNALLQANGVFSRFVEIWNI